MASFVKVPKHLLSLPSAFARALKKGARSAQNSIKNAVADSIARRWYNTGESKNAIEAETEEAAGGNYRVVVRSGTSYDVFGEYGTGTRGEENAPKFRPSGWKYGDIGGMKPRMAFHLGAEEALEDVKKDFQTAFRREMNG